MILRRLGEILLTWTFIAISMAVLLLALVGFILSQHTEVMRGPTILLSSAFMLASGMTFWAGWHLMNARHRTGHTQARRLWRR